VKKSFAAIVLALGVSGCSLVPLADNTRDAELKTFPVVPDAASLYIYRDDPAGALVRVDVKLNGELLGKTATLTYLHRTLAPGKHTIESVSENNAKLEVEAKAGQLIFVRQELTIGLVPMFPGTKLLLMGEEDGKKGVLESKLVRSPAK
jgi:Protein of unknown function (DUF2846)/Prokaryotic membrane lipoprotein lipid attachment site